MKAENDHVAPDVEVIGGGSGNDTIQGGPVANFLYGVGGNDTLLGGGGADYLYGGDAADTLDGEEGLDTLFGEAGYDSVYTLDGSFDSVSCGDIADDGAVTDAAIGLDAFTNCVLPF